MAQIWMSDFYFKCIWHLIGQAAAPHGATGNAHARSWDFQLVHGEEDGQSDATISGGQCNDHGCMVTLVAGLLGRDAHGAISPLTRTTGSVRRDQQDKEGHHVGYFTRQPADHTQQAIDAADPSHRCVLPHVPQCASVEEPWEGTRQKLSDSIRFS
jgi:hypothetical protein